MAELNNTLEELSKNPLFQMSLGSKELFHSNFLAWLFVQDPEFAANWLSSFDHLPDELSLRDNDPIDREKGNTDLWLHFNEGDIIIENKVKSVPYTKQLDDYAKKNGSSHSYLLLSLTKPEFFNGNTYTCSFDNKTIDWFHISYGDVASAIREHFTTNTSNEQYANDYIDFIDKLDELAQLLPVNKETDQYDFAWGHTPIDQGNINLRKYRLHDLYTKHKMDSFAEILRNELSDDIKVDWGFSNGTGIVTARKRNDGAEIGVQLQNNAFRLYTYWKDDKGRSKQLRDNLKANDLWFNFEWTSIHHIADDIKGSGKNRQGNYNNYSGQFFYKYIKLYDKSVLDVLHYFNETFRNFEAHREQIAQNVRRIN